MELDRGRSDVLELTASDADVQMVTEQLGRKPMGRFRVVVRDANGWPVVIQNSPRMDDGTPMPTLYWLTGPEQIRLVGQIESTGGVDEAESAIDPDEIEAVHARYAAEREALLIELDGEATDLPKPYGGVAGTRRGVKCLHAHYAYYLAGGDDPVGRWVGARLRRMSKHP